MKPYYDDGQVTLFHGDSREILPAIGDFGLMLTDPPYGVTANDWDTVDAVADLIGAAPLAVFTTGERLLFDLAARMPKRYRHLWIWDRVNRKTDFLNSGRRPLRRHELVAVFSKSATYPFEPQKVDGKPYVRGRLGSSTCYQHRNIHPQVGQVETKRHPTTVIEIPCDFNRKGQHPTPKPPALFEYLLRTYPADVTVDPFCGGGASLIAAATVGRRMVGIEREERYCELAATRLQAMRSSEVPAAA